MNSCSPFSIPWNFSRNRSRRLQQILKAYAIVQVEAMAYGKPIVSTRIAGSGVDWVNQNEISGITVPPEDSEQLANAINLLLNNADLYQQYSNGSLTRYTENFTKEIMINKLINYYQELLHKQ